MSTSTTSAVVGINNDILSTLGNVLDNGSSTDNAIQQEVMMTLNELSNTLGPDGMARYLVIIFASKSDANTKQYSPHTRQRAGLLLKNIIQSNKQMVITSSVKSAILEACRYDGDADVRSTACSLIASIVSVHGVGAWPDCMHILANGLADTSLDVVDGSFKALKYVCEDGVDIYRQQLLAYRKDDAAVSSSPFIQFADTDLIPKLLEVCTTLGAPDKYKALSLNILHLFVCSFLMMPGATRLDHHMEAYFNSLGSLAANSHSPSVLKEICIGFVHCANHQPDLLENHLPQIMQFMLERSSQESPVEVRREALEFWPAVCLNTQWLPYIQSPDSLNIILPTLLNNMVYAKEDFESMESGLVGDDSHIQDEVNDTAPIFHQDRSRHNDDDVGGNGEDDDEPGDEEDRAVGGNGPRGGGGNMSTWGNEWTVRKAAANALDNMASALNDDILPILLPLIEKGLTNTADWQQQEASVLAVGAIAHGCDTGLGRHMNTLLPLLIQTTESNQPLLRSIGCWALGRFARWLAAQDSNTALNLATTAILQRCVDKNKRVQEAAISALAGLIEESGHRIRDDTDLINKIIQVMKIAIRFYQYKNLLILLDAIGTFIGSIGADVLCKVPAMNMELIPTMLQRFNMVTNDNDKCLISLLEALTPILWSPELAAAGLGQDGVTIVVNRCGRIIQNYLEYINIPQSDNDGIDPDIVAAALDCLSAVAEGLHASQIFTDIIPIVVRMIQATARSTTTTSSNIPSQVTQALYALLGDLSRYCITLIVPHLSMILPPTIQYMDNGSYSTCNNAIWAIGEICVAVAATTTTPSTHNNNNNNKFDMKPYSGVIGTKLTSILETGHLQRPLLIQNAAITFGRLALVCPEDIGHNALPNAIIPWCMAISQMRNDIEKAHAIHGICLALEVNPSCGMALPDRLCGILSVAASLYPPPPPSSSNTQLHDAIQMCHQLVHGYKSVLSKDDWDRLWNSLPNDIQYKLTTIYAL